MNTLIVQSLRGKVKRRVDRFDESDDPDTIFGKLVQSWHFFRQQPMLVGVAEALPLQSPEMDEAVRCTFAGRCSWPKSEEEAAALAYRVQQRLVDDEPGLLHEVLMCASYAVSGKSQALSFLRFFVYPLWCYIDEQLDDQGAMLALLRRYKHRSEWFRWEDLQRQSQATYAETGRSKAEKLLALDLYGFLYDQGIDFYIEPSSLPGEIDLIAAQPTDDPLLLDVKVFDNKGRDKAYLCSGFHQIYRYTQQFNEPFGYLLIYNTSE